MPQINYTLNLKIVLHLAFLINFILIIGIGNSSWVGFFGWVVFFTCIYSANISFKKGNWFLIIFLTIFCLCIKSFFSTPLIVEGSNVFIGGNFDNSIFEKKLPKVIFNQLNDDFKKTFPKSISAPSPYLFDNGVSKIIKKSPESRYVKEINWENRYALQLSAFNNTKYNAYNDQQPKRELLPFFVKYTFPIDFNNNTSELCWKGQAYIENEIFTNLYHAKKKCILIKDYYHKENKKFIIWFVETGKTTNLNVTFYPPKFIKYKILIFNYLKAILAICACFIIFTNFKKFNLLSISFSMSFSFLLMYFYQPTILDKFILFEGGNDGLLYVHFAHLITDNLISKDYLEAFRGGESAYDLMPFYRYMWVLNYIFFDESPWIIFFTIVFIPLVLYSIIKNLLSKSWAIFFIICWYFIPLFEAFGFFHFYYIKLAMRGFAEPLSNLLFFLSVAIITNIYKTKNSLITNEYINYFLIGLLLSTALGLRANILPAFSVIIFYLSVIILKERKYSTFFYLAAGLTPCLIMPVHNFLFTGEFIPLTIAAYKDWNLGAKPSDYMMLIISLLKFNIDLEVWNKISNHVSDEIKYYEIWYHLAILATFFTAIRKKSNDIIRLISWSAASMLVLILFYHVGGRYSYLTWTLCLIVFSFWVKNIIFPFLNKLRNHNAS